MDHTQMRPTDTTNAQRRVQSQDQFNTTTTSSSSSFNTNTNPSSDDSPPSNVPERPNLTTDEKTCSACDHFKNLKATLMASSVLSDLAGSTTSFAAVMFILSIVALLSIAISPSQPMLTFTFFGWEELAWVVEVDQGPDFSIEGSTTATTTLLGHAPTSQDSSQQTYVLHHFYFVWNYFSNGTVPEQLRQKRQSCFVEVFADRTSVVSTGSDVIESNESSYQLTENYDATTSTTGSSLSSSTTTNVPGKLANYEGHGTWREYFDAECKVAAAYLFGRDYLGISGQTNRSDIVMVHAPNSDIAEQAGNTSDETNITNATTPTHHVLQSAQAILSSPVTGPILDEYRAHLFIIVACIAQGIAAVLILAFGGPLALICSESGRPGSSGSDGSSHGGGSSNADQKYSPGDIRDGQDNKYAATTELQRNGFASKSGRVFRNWRSQASTRAHDLQIQEQEQQKNKHRKAVHRQTVLQRSSSNEHQQQTIIGGRGRSAGDAHSSSLGHSNMNFNRSVNADTPEGMPSILIYHPSNSPATAADPPSMSPPPGVSMTLPPPDEPENSPPITVDEHGAPFDAGEHLKEGDDTSNRNLGDDVDTAVDMDRGSSSGAKRAVRFNPDLAVIEVEGRDETERSNRRRESKVISTNRRAGRFVFKSVEHHATVTTCSGNVQSSIPFIIAVTLHLAVVVLTIVFVIDIRHLKSETMARATDRFHSMVATLDAITPTTVDINNDSTVSIRSYPLSNFVIDWELSHGGVLLCAAMAINILSVAIGIFRLLISVGLWVQIREREARSAHRRQLISMARDSVVSDDTNPNTPPSGSETCSGSAPLVSHNEDNAELPERDTTRLRRLEAKRWPNASSSPPPQLGSGTNIASIPTSPTAIVPSEPTAAPPSPSVLVPIIAVNDDNASANVVPPSFSTRKDLSNGNTHQSVNNNGKANRAQKKSRAASALGALRAFTTTSANKGQPQQTITTTTDHAGAPSSHVYGLPLVVASASSVDEVASTVSESPRTGSVPQTMTANNNTGKVINATDASERLNPQEVPPAASFRTDQQQPSPKPAIMADNNNAATSYVIQSSSSAQSADIYGAHSRAATGYVEDACEYSSSGGTSANSPFGLGVVERFEITRRTDAPVARQIKTAPEIVTKSIVITAEMKELPVGVASSTFKTAANGPRAIELALAALLRNDMMDGDSASAHHPEMTRATLQDPFGDDFVPLGPNQPSSVRSNVTIPTSSMSPLHPQYCHTATVETGATNASLSLRPKRGARMPREEEGAALLDFSSIGDNSNSSVTILQATNNSGGGGGGGGQPRQQQPQHYDVCSTFSHSSAGT